MPGAVFGAPGWSREFNVGLLFDLYYGFYIQPLPLIPSAQVNELRKFVSYLPDGAQVLRNLKLAEFVDRSFLQHFVFDN